MNFNLHFSEIKWYLLACVICFFGIPFLAALLPQFGGILQIISQFANIAVIDVTSFLCGYRQFRWYYPILAMLLFAIPSLVANLYTPDTTTAMSLYYLVLGYIAAGIGAIIGKIRK